MSIEMDLFGYLQLNLPTLNIFYGKVKATSGEKTVSFFRLPAGVAIDAPVKGAIYQISCWDREIDDARKVADSIVALLRGLNGRLNTQNIRVLDIQDLGDLYEDDSKLAQVILQITTQIVE